MSFLYRTTPALRTALATSSHQPARVFSTSLIQQKSATETAKDALKSVDKTVSGAAVKGIDAATDLKNKAASSISSEQSEASGKVSELAGQAKGKAAEVTGQAKGKAQELKGEAKGKMS